MVVDVKAVCKSQGLSFREVSGNFFLIELGLLFIIHQNHDDVRLLCCFSGV